VRTLGRVRRNGLHATRGTYHDDAMLTICLAGLGWYLRGDQRVAVTPGMVGLVLPSADPGVLMADGDDPYDHVYCRFSGTEALPLARQVHEQRGDAFAAHPAWRAVGDGLLRGLARGWEGNESGRALSPRDSLLVEALAILAGHDAEETPSVWTAEGLRECLRDRISEPIDLGRLARELGVSRSTLTRRCRSLLGVSVGQAWEATKMDWARVLLAHTPLPIHEVAERVGYDAFYFSRRFSQRFGRPPSRCRGR
jgi:AraC-like DNA-binding protein